MPKRSRPPATKLLRAAADELGLTTPKKIRKVSPRTAKKARSRVNNF
jgi:hypothetical protein